MLLRCIKLPAESAGNPIMSDKPSATTDDETLAESSRQGLYSPAHEHDACGVGFVAHIKGQRSHQIIEQGLQILANLDHRVAAAWRVRRRDDLPAEGTCFTPRVRAGAGASSQGGGPDPHRLVGCPRRP